MKPTLTLITALLLAPLVTHAGITEVRPVCVERDGIQRIEYHSGETLIASDECFSRVVFNPLNAIPLDTHRTNFGDACVRDQRREQQGSDKRESGFHCQST